MGESGTKAIAEHLQELRGRLLVCVVVLLAGAGIGFWQRSAVEVWLQQPLHAPLYYTAPSAGFQYALLVSLAVGAVVAIPAFIYQALAFVAPAVPQVPRLHRHGLRIVLAATVLAFSGGALAYYILLPTALHFFASFDSQSIHSIISTGEYLSFAVGCLVTSAAIFQLPLILLFIDRITPLPPRRLMRYQRHVFVGSLALALVLPFTYDPLSQFLIAVPVVGLYELSIIVLWQRHHRQPSAIRQARPVTLQPVTPIPPIAAQALPPKTIDRTRLVQLG
jgi:sec-independent protein translocase protein TatC